MRDGVDLPTLTFVITVFLLVLPRKRLLHVVDGARVNVPLVVDEHVYGERGDNHSHDE